MNSASRPGDNHGRGTGRGREPKGAFLSLVSLGDVMYGNWVSSSFSTVLSGTKEGPESCDLEP